MSGTGVKAAQKTNTFFRLTTYWQTSAFTGRVRSWRSCMEKDTPVSDKPRL